MDLDAAACRTGTGAAEHDHDQQAPGVLGPEVKIRCRVAGGRDDGAHLEGRMVECKIKVFKHPPDVDRDRQDTEGDDPKVPSHLTEAECLFFVLSEEKDKVGIEVNAEEDHEDGDNGLLYKGIAGDTVAQHAETSGTGSAETETEAVKEGHARNEII